jgi:hypothetical protein
MEQRVSAARAQPVVALLAGLPVQVQEQFVQCRVPEAEELPLSSGMRRKWSHSKSSIRPIKEQSFSFYLSFKFIETLL